MRLFWMALALIGFILLLLMASSVLSTDAVSGDQWARFSYLALIGLLVISAILGSAMRLGEIVRHGLVWCALIFTLLLSYNHRYQLQDVGHQMTMGLFPASPLSRTEENSITVSLRRAANGHFETQGLINHQAPIYFMLDTGASSVVLSYEDARRAGIDVGGLVFSITTATANGEARAAPIRLQSLKIGEIERNNIRALVAQPQALSDSLLGMNFLNSLSGYNVRADRLTLID